MCVSLSLEDPFTPLVATFCAARGIDTSAAMQTPAARTAKLFIDLPLLSRCSSRVTDRNLGKAWKLPDAAPSGFQIACHAVRPFVNCRHISQTSHQPTD